MNEASAGPASPSARLRVAHPRTVHGRTAELGSARSPSVSSLLAALALCAGAALAPSGGAVAAAAVHTAEEPARANVLDAAERLRRVEVRYLDAADAYAAMETIESGLLREYEGRDLEAWRAARAAAIADVRRDLPRIARESLASAADRRALDLIATGIDALAAGGSLAPHANCADARRRNAGAAALRAALYACFDVHARAIPFEGRVLTRQATYTELAVLEPAARRRELFLALEPLWRALNGRNEASSPYRRMLRATVADPQWRSPVAAAARSLGIAPADVERWLVTMLEAWSAVDAGRSIEPWDYRWEQGAAYRDLARCIPRDAVVDASRRFYRDLGVDLDALGVVHDVDVRPGKAPLAYSIAMRYGREVNGEWRPTVPRVSAILLSGGLSELNELVHEDGHAVQYAAIRTRPAFQVDGGEDALLWEAFADVPSWATYDVGWQRRYLGCESVAKHNLRAQYGMVMLDVAWGLFDVRMLQDPARDPNAVWTEITSRYLHIVPHPELSWWAQRVQLVDSPGYMVTYALGAALTSDLRARTTAAIGAFDAGNPRWYGWLQAELLGAGAERTSAETLARFLGRAPSTAAIVADLERTARAVRAQH